jgi:hypothetical protein
MSHETDAKDSETEKALRATASCVSVIKEPTREKGFYGADLAVFQHIFAHASRRGLLNCLSGRF